MSIATVSRRVIAAGLFAIVSIFGSTGTTLAGDFTFNMKNSHPNALRVELYSQDRDHVWPGGGEDYYLDDGEEKEMSLSCEEGEAICYGAWIDGDEATYWGVGPGNSQRCEDCCYTCGDGSTFTINLVP